MLDCTATAGRRAARDHPEPQPKTLLRLLPTTVARSAVLKLYPGANDGGAVYREQGGVS